MSLHDSLQQLVGVFYRDIALAKQLESPNQSDDLAIKAAVVGFSYNSSTPDWEQGHFDFVVSRLEQDYHDEELSEYGENGENVRLFYALAIGYLLGLYQQGRMSDQEFKIADQQIAGLIMLRLPELTAKSI